jgi:hypothetical protein
MPKGKDQVEAAKVLRAARERISDPERWTQGVEALTACGRCVPGDDPDAVRWCVAGAVRAEGLDACSNPLMGVTPVARLIMKAAGCGDVGIGPWNDKATHSEVIAALDRAIELAASTANPCHPTPKKSHSGLDSPSRSFRRRSVTCSSPPSSSPPSSTCGASKDAVTHV